MDGVLRLGGESSVRTDYLNFRDPAAVPVRHVCPLDEILPLSILVTLKPKAACYDSVSVVERWWTAFPLALTGLCVWSSSSLASSIVGGSLHLQVSIR